MRNAIAGLRWGRRRSFSTWLARTCSGSSSAPWRPARGVGSCLPCSGGTWI
jgi:hypothetical protein